MAYSFMYFEINSLYHVVSGKCPGQSSKSKNKRRAITRRLGNILE